MHLNVLTKVAFEDEPVHIRKGDKVTDGVDIPFIRFVRSTNHLGDGENEEDGYDAKEDPTAKEEGRQNQGDENAGHDDAGTKRCFLFRRDLVHLRITHFLSPQIGDFALGIREGSQ
jgi:hypothetical protein